MKPESMKQSGIVLAATLCFATSPAFGVPETESISNSIVKVIAEQDGTQQQYVGIALGEQKILTPSIRNWENAEFTVISPIDSSTFNSTAIQIADELPLILLTVADFQLGAPTVSQAMVTSGQTVYSPRIETETVETIRGAVADVGEFQPQKWGLFSKKNKGPLLQLIFHNALVAADHFGAPLYDECGNIVGVSIADPRLNKADQKKDPEEAVVALNISQISQWLEAVNIQFNVAEEECISVELQAEESRNKVTEAEAAVADAEESLRTAQSQSEEQEAAVADAEESLRTAQSQSEEQQAAAQQALDEASANLEGARSAAQLLEQELERVKEEATQANADLEQSRREAQLLEQELERTREEDERKRSEIFKKIELYGGIAVGILLLVVLLWWMNTRSKNKQITTAHQQAESAESKARKVVAEQRQRLAPFECILEGVDSSGKRYLIKFHKQALGTPQGVVLGRSPRNAAFIIEHAKVGREHARLYVKEGTLFVQDLSSTNGTWVDGQKVEAKESAKLSNGATLEFGPVRFRVQLIS